MKKTIVMILILALVLASAGCAKQENSGPPVQPEDPVLQKTADFLANEPDAAAIGIFIRESEQEIKTQAGDLLLERLIITQLDVIADFNAKIYQDPYMTALNATMGGVLDEAKIKDIPDETVRNDYQMLHDGFLKIVRYEETPVVEPDWSALAGYAACFTAEASGMAELCDRLQNRYYFGDPMNFDLLAEDTAKTEKLIRDAKNSFVRWQLDRLYDRQIGNLLVGPEGSYLEEFATGQEAAQARISAYAEKYKDSDLGILCARLLNSDTKEMMPLSDLILYSRYFSPGDQKKVARISGSIGGANCNYAELSGLGDQEHQKNINQQIRSAVEALVNKDTPDQFVSASVIFGNGNFISLDLANSYTDAAGAFKYIERYLTFDLSTGEQIGLDALFGDSFENYRDKLQTAMSKRNISQPLDKAPEYLLDDQGMTLMIPGSDPGSTSYVQLTLNDLRQFMDITKLY